MQAREQDLGEDPRVLARERAVAGGEGFPLVQPSHTWRRMASLLLHILDVALRRLAHAWHSACTVSSGALLANGMGSCSPRDEIQKYFLSFFSICTELQALPEDRSLASLKPLLRDDLKAMFNLNCVVNSHRPQPYV